VEQFYLLILVGLTSACACLVEARRSRRSGTTLWRAVGKMFEGIGLMAVFLVINVAVGAIAALATRAFLREIVSPYFVADPTLLGLSLLQALAFQWWREFSNRPLD
jgi:hypothetical protein